MGFQYKPRRKAEGRTGLFPSSPRPPVLIPDADSHPWHWGLGFIPSSKEMYASPGATFPLTLERWDLRLFVARHAESIREKDLACKCAQTPSSISLSTIRDYLWNQPLKGKNAVRCSETSMRFTGVALEVWRYSRRIVKLGGWTWIVQCFPLVGQNTLVNETGVKQGSTFEGRLRSQTKGPNVKAERRAGGGDGRENRIRLQV